MKTLIMGTTNQAKLSQIRDCLLPIGIDVQGVADKKLLPNVVEDGTTVQENARKKALAYSTALNQRVFSMDNALFLDGLPPEQQPGVHVRRINGKDAQSDQEILDHYTALVASLGDTIKGHWDFGVCVADPNGQVWETVISCPRVFKATASNIVQAGYPLESIQIDPTSGKYISEMSVSERAAFWQKAIGQKLVSFIELIM